MMKQQFGPMLELGHSLIFAFVGLTPLCGPAKNKHNILKMSTDAGVH